MPEGGSKSTLAANSNFIEGRNRRRSERVVLRVPIRLSAIMPDGKRISVETRTLVVNAHGGLLDVGMEMVRGQQIRLNRPKTETTTTGRVLRVEGSEEGRFLVAFEFESPAPNFWPVRFPPANWSAAEAKA